MTNHNNLPLHSRVWIYQADRTLAPAEVNVVYERFDEFMKKWHSHGQPLSAAYEVRYDKFLILYVDEATAPVSGCSIDSSVAVVKSLEADLGIEFMNRQLIAWKEGIEIKQLPMSEFWAHRKAGLVTSETIVFNNLVKNKQEFLAGWEGPFSESWHATMW
jgi:hypothetical protein